MNIIVSFFETKGVSEIIVNWTKDYIGILLLTYGLTRDINNILGSLIAVIGYALIKAKIEINRRNK